MRRRITITVVCMLILAGVYALYGQSPEPAATGTAAETPAAQAPLAKGLMALAVALIVAAGAIGTAWAQAAIGPAVTAACAEDRKFFGLGLLLLALPETILILSLGLALMLLFKIV
ncbi:MAG: F0F1 ATP synthase subunit C [Planctomycetota bacterium]